MRPMRPLLAGNSQAAVDVLDLLLEEWDAGDLLVIAPPHGPKHDWQPSLADHADRRGVSVLTPERVNNPDVVAQVADHGTDLLLSVYYTQLFDESLLGTVDGLAVNFHPSLLPRHRGTAPLIWAIAEGDTMTGVSVHELTLGVDTGPLLWQRPLAIHPDDTGFTLHLKAALLVSATAAELLRRVAGGRALPEPVQQSGTATVHTSRDPQLNRIDWSDSAERVRNIIRALAAPLPGAYTTWQGRTLGLEELRLVNATGPARTPGMVERDDGRMLVWAGDHPLEIVSARFEDSFLDQDALAELGIGEGELLG